MKKVIYNKIENGRILRFDKDSTEIHILTGKPIKVGDAIPYAADENEFNKIKSCFPNEIEFVEYYREPKQEEVIELILEPEDLDLSEMNVKNALIAISEITDINLLESVNDLRKTVTKAVEKKIGELKTAI